MSPGEWQVFSVNRLAGRIVGNEVLHPTGGQDWRRGMGIGNGCSLPAFALSSCRGIQAHEETLSSSHNYRAGLQSCESATTSADRLRGRKTRKG
jgi:hypothetical protein